LEYDDITSGEGDWDQLTVSKLVALHSRVIEDTHKVARAVCLYEMLLSKAFAIEDIIRLKETGGSPDKKMHYSFRSPRTYKYAYIVDTGEYYWEMYIHPSAYRILGVFAAILSILVVWCEITLVVNKDKYDLSPFSQLITAMHMEGFGKQLFCFIPLAYMAVCAYTTLFKIKIVNYYRLVPHQMSDAHSIMFSSNYLSRLAAPLSYNFLKLVNQPDSSFTAVMGEMDAFPVLGRQFTIFFPIFVAVLCLFSLFNVWSKIGSMCCIKSLRYIPEDDFKLVNDGEKILKDERDIKEGRGPAKEKTFTDSIKSLLPRGKSKAGKNDDYDDNKSKPQVTSAPAAPAAPLSAAKQISMKYSRLEDGADLLPASSKFSNSNNNNNNNNSPASVSGGSMRGSTRSNNYDDLLPANSRFAKKNNAIIDVNISPIDDTKSFAKSTYSSSSLSSSASAQKSTSVFGGLFGGKSRVDEVGLLPRGSARSDSIV